VKRRISGDPGTTRFFVAPLLRMTGESGVSGGEVINSSVSSSFPIQNLMLDVRCSFFQSLLGENNLALMGDGGLEMQG